MGLQPMLHLQTLGHLVERNVFGFLDEVEQEGLARVQDRTARIALPAGESEE